MYVKIKMGDVMANYEGKTIRDIFIIKRNEKNLEKVKGKGGIDPVYDCKCLLCGKIFSRSIGKIKNNVYGNCGCKSLQYDLAGKKFGLLTAIRPLGLNKHKEKIWECVCECGEIVYKTSFALRKVIKTGCKKCQNKHTGEKNRKGYRYSTRLFECWVNMKTRATNVKQDISNRYINRGIDICEEWAKDYYTFEKWALENGYQENLTIDRIDNNKGYSPENCRWADKIQQANNRRSNRMIEYNGEIDTLANWSRRFNVKYSALSYQLGKGLTLDKALEVIYDNSSGYKATDTQR